MKKIIIAIAIVLTAGTLTFIAGNSSVKAEKITKASAVYNKSISLGTAD